MDTKSGMLKVGNEQDRLTVASILLKNGYAVSFKREKVSNKGEWYIAFTKATGDSAADHRQLQG